MAYKHNGVVYVHGGINLEWAQKAANYNKSSDPVSNLNTWAHKQIRLNKFTDRIFRDGQKPELGLSDDELAEPGPLWDRGFVNGDCRHIDEILGILKATHM
jgi:hypothetical protein